MNAWLYITNVHRNMAETWYQKSQNREKDDKKISNFPFWKVKDYRDYDVHSYLKSWCGRHICEIVQNIDRMMTSKLGKYQIWVRKW